ncbi:MAG: hypothetical protein DWQ05_08330 [Calditrichaeota bacterium]|nr:MAG: hypothetical protein DWQ05_08330 [Calditrichota bacterium]
MKHLHINKEHKKIISLMLKKKIYDLETFIDECIKTTETSISENHNYKSLRFTHGVYAKLVSDYNKALEIATQFSYLLKFLCEHEIIILNKSLYKTHFPDKLPLLEMRTLNGKHSLFDNFYNLFDEKIFRSRFVDNGLKEFKKNGYKTFDQYSTKKIFNYKTITTIIKIIGFVVSIMYAIFHFFIEKPKVITAVRKPSNSSLKTNLISRQDSLNNPIDEEKNSLQNRK